MDTITLLREQFKTLDADGSGELDADDVGMLRQACRMLEAGTLVLPSPSAGSGNGGGGLVLGGDHGGGGGDDGEPPTSQTRANLPPLYKSPPEQSYLAGEGALTLSAPTSFHSLDTSTAAASIDRLSAMYRDVAAQQLAMVDELAKLSASLTKERSASPPMYSIAASQPEQRRQLSQRPGGGRAPITAGLGSRGSPTSSERDPARRLAFPSSQQREGNNVASGGQAPPIAEEEAETWTARSFLLPAWARPSPTLNA